jgi:hypothetical protein
MSFQHRFVQGLGVEKRTHPPHLLGRILLAIALLVLGMQAASADAVCTQSNGQWTCVCSPKSGNGYSSLDESPDKPWRSAQTAPDLDVTGPCSVPLSQTYYFRNVNIRKSGPSRSVLLFEEASLRDQNNNPIPNSRTEFWASSIIIENGGEFYAYGSDSGQAFGSNGGVLTIHLYGKNEAEGDPNTQNQGALCKSPLGTPGPGKTPAPCGIPQATWESNGASKVDLPSLDAQGKQISDYFYQYGPLHGDGRCDDGSVFKVINGKGTCNTSTGQVGYFGNKVLAVSYGGSLYLTGYKGTTNQTREAQQDGNALSSGRSWRRLADGHSLAAGATVLYMQYDNDLDPALVDLGWKQNDEIVVTTTDYLPGHSERLQVNTIGSSSPGQLVRVDFSALDNPPGKTGLQWPHNGVRYGGPNDTPPGS